MAYRLLVTGLGLQVSGRRSHVARRRSQVAGHQSQVPGCWVLGTFRLGRLRPATRDLRSETCDVRLVTYAVQRFVRGYCDRRHNQAGMAMTIEMSAAHFVQNRIPDRLENS